MIFCTLRFLTSAFPWANSISPCYIPCLGLIWSLFLLFSALMYRFLSDPDSSDPFCSQWGSCKCCHWIKSEAGSSKAGQRNWAVAVPSSFHWLWKQPAVSRWQAEFTWIHTTIPNALECLTGLQMCFHKGTDLPCVPDLLPSQMP